MSLHRTGLTRDAGYINREMKTELLTNTDKQHLLTLSSGCLSEEEPQLSLSAAIYVIYVIYKRSVNTE